MTAVTKRLWFPITSSTSYKQPHIVANRFSTLGHLTKSRFDWNMVTGWRETTPKAVRDRFQCWEYYS